MWKKIAPLLVVLSVALNIAFISVWAVHAARTHWPTDAAGDSEMWCPLHRRLNVTDEQWQRIEPRITEFRARSQTICAELNRLRTELIDLIASDDPDRQAIAAKQEEILAGQRKMQQLVIEHLLAEKEALTPQQQEELFNLFRRRSGCTAHPMVGLSQAESGTAPREHPHHPGTRNQGE